MSQRHATFAFVAAVAETSCVVTSSALGLSALRIQSVSKKVIQIVNMAGEVVTTVALQTGRLMLVTANAPTGFESGSITVPVSPVVGMYVGQSD